MAILVDSYDGGDNADESAANNGVWLAQTITTTEAYSVISVTLNIRRVLSPGDVTAAIWGLTAGDPDNAKILASGTIDGNALDTSMAQVSIEFDSPAALEDATQYAIVLKGSAAAGNNCNWSGDNTSPSYGGGNNKNSGNGGDTWTNVPGADSPFQTYKADPPTGNFFTIF